jgi:hypothetical protein
MATPTLSPPRPPRASPEVPAVSRPRAPRARRKPHGLNGRAWAWAFAISLVFHILVLVVSPLFIRIGLPPGSADEATSGEPSQGLRVVRVVPSTDVAADADEVALQDPSEVVPPPRASDLAFPAQPVPVTPGTARGTAPPDEADATGRADSPFRTGVRDPRLWVNPNDPPLPERELTQEELHARYMTQLEARIRSWNDSIAGDAERARRATDWTVKDGSGGRWGVSPEGIHLGGVTLPPVTFPPGGGDPDQRRRAEEQARTRGEIDRQEADAERRRAQQEAARSTRERRNAERAAEQ